MIVGHGSICSALLVHGAPALLLGPASVGKFTLARQVSYQLGVKPSDLFCLDRLLSPDARAVGDLARREPFGELRVFVIRLDGATEQALNVLLKVLEEPPETTRFFLVASSPPLATVTSRCTVHRFGLLSDEQVAEVLVLTGMDPEEARKRAPLGGGRVRPAMEGEDSRSRAMVTAVLRAVAARDQQQLDTALSQWDAAAHDLLGQWAAEAAVGRWRQFTPDSAPGLGQPGARKMLGALAQFSRANPRLAASAALAQLIR